MIAYVDEFGNISNTPPEPGMREKIDAGSIEIGVPKQEKVQDRNSVREGRLTFFNPSKGYGFIQESGSRDSLFVHVNDMQEQLEINDTVQFRVEKGKRGPIAVDVKRI
jgi:cold shock CspA family protein